MIVRTCRRRLLLPQVDGGQLQPAVRDDPGRGDPLPAGHPETLQDHHEHERDPGDSLVGGEGQRWRRCILQRASVFDLWPLRETLTRSCDFPLKGSSGFRVTCGPRVSPLHIPSSNLEIFDTAEVGSSSVQEIPPKNSQRNPSKNNEHLKRFQLKELVSC